MHIMSCLIAMLAFCCPQWHENALRFDFGFALWGFLLLERSDDGRRRVVCPQKEYHGECHDVHVCLCAPNHTIWDIVRTTVSQDAYLLTKKGISSESGAIPELWICHISLSSWICQWWDSCQRQGRTSPQPLHAPDQTGSGERREPRFCSL